MFTTGWEFPCAFSGSMYCVQTDHDTPVARPAIPEAAHVAFVSG